MHAVADPKAAPAPSPARAITSSLVGEPSLVDETAGPRSRLLLLRNPRSSAAALNCGRFNRSNYPSSADCLVGGHHRCRARGTHLDWRNHAKDSDAASGRLRIAWAALFAALCLALPIGGAASTRPRAAAPLDAIPAGILDAFGRTEWCRFPEAIPQQTAIPRAYRATAAGWRFCGSEGKILPMCW